MKTLGQSNILLNSCGSNVCNSPHKCIDEWYVYCNDWKNNIQPFDTNGQSCANKDTHHCDCQSYVNILTNVFINDSSMTQCDINGSNDKSLPIHKLNVIVIRVVFGVIFVFGLFLCILFHIF